MSVSEYLGSAKAIIILWTFNVLLQLFISGVKFLKFRNEQPPEKLKTLERLLDSTYCLSIISILNIIAFSTYTFAAVVTYFFFASFIAVDLLKGKFPESRRKVMTTVIPGVWLFMLFLNFWINNQANFGN